MQLELAQKIIHLQSLVNEKEAEWIEYVNSNEIPHPLRIMLIEWCDLKSQVSEATRQLANAYEIKENEFQKKLEEIESKYPEEMVRRWKSHIH